MPALVLSLVLAASGAVRAPSPRLVVVITVDQLRPDYLERYRGQLIGGLGLLLRGGAVFTDAYQDQAVTETAPGHATVLSGRWPAHTGIVRNGAGVQDSSAPLLAVAGPGASPARFRGTAFFDWLQAAQPGARALSVSRKDRGAILPLGRARQQVYWYQSGVFTTSRYYADSLPGWVREFNAQRIPFRAAGAVWTPLLPAGDYAEPDSQPYEHGGHDVTFPHRLPADSADAAAAFTAIPTMDSLTLAFALAGVRALELGGRGATDLVAVSLSATDAVGHAFGPDSREIHDQVLRLDRYLGWFLGQLFVRFGAGDIVIALTADHGVTPLPEWSRLHGHPEARRVAVDSIVLDVNARLGQRTTRAEWLIFDTGLLLVPGRATLAAAKVNVDSVIDDVAARLRAVPGVATVRRPADLSRADTAADPVARRWQHAIPPDAEVALMVTLRPYSIWSDAGSSEAAHGQPSDFDAHVPLILWGQRIRSGTYPGRVAEVDLAPTLARLLGLTPAEPVDGRVLVEALERRD
jgi:predicted AlkP superfamily pyrophosphatase or phosphodiesterase